MLKPIGSRLIVKPDAAATESAGGIIFPQTHGSAPAMTGTVVSVGRGPATAHRVRQATLARVMSAIDTLAKQTPTAAFRAALEDEIARMAVEDVTFSELAEGQYVCFPYTAGHNMQVDGDSYVVIDEGDVQAVWTAEERQIA